MLKDLLLIGHECFDQEIGQRTHRPGHTKVKHNL